jgi:hypothetical protein
VDVLVLLARQHGDPRLPGEAVVALDVLVGDDEAASFERMEEAAPHQSAADEHRVLRRGRRGPHESGARGGVLAQPPQGRERPARRIAAALRDHRVGHGLVQRAAVGVQLLEAGPLARQRAALARRPPPGGVGVHLEVDHGVGWQCLAHALRRRRAAAQRHDPRVRARE